MKKFINSIKDLNKKFEKQQSKNKILLSSFSLKFKELKTNINQTITEKEISKILKDKYNLQLLSLKEKINPTIWLQKAQDKVEKVFQGETNLVFLKQSKFWARSITWVLMSGAALSVGWISIAETDEVVQAIGKLEPKGGVIDVQMPLEGIASEILVKEGEKVRKGQTLIKLDTEITEAQNDSLRTTLILNENILSKLAILVKEGAISEVQFLEQKAKVENIKSEIKAGLVRIKYQEIKSPSDGRVFDLQPKGPGYVGRSSQPVLQIVPEDNLIAKVTIDSRTIGFVKEGKRVEISIDSFPSRDFGVIDGTVTRIGSDALPPDPSQGKGYRFPANIKLDNQYLQIKSGKKLPLQAGMSLNANIKLRKVTYLKLLLSKFGDKAESLNSI
tara:strand:+ start:1703 stop:2866 length:1164 start_codon:yes stop_codon:yes gene_type:complete